MGVEATPTPSPSMMEREPPYGDLSQETQVISTDYEEEDEETIEPFREKNLRVFVNVTSEEFSESSYNTMDFNILLCESFEDLLTSYFQDFRIEGADKPWKAFMGDWIMDEIMRAYGIEYDGKPNSCCYVLVKMNKVNRTVKVGNLTDIAIKDYVNKAIENLNISDASAVRKFMKSYGTHYIDSYVTGDSIYQVFKYKRSGYNFLRSKLRSNRKAFQDNLRFYFSSYFLKEVGEIRLASGNKTIETWAHQNLRDSQYLYSRPSLLRLHYNPYLASKLNDLLDNSALISINLKTLKPLFKDKYKAEMYAEIVENDMKLWEINV
ncbi:torso-like protein [Hyposmocoma kahamanoa]|uniref:torso-like protein n=1 Tax=Hyposmocoma kahamanoa TaxID=1477025 RepID=UPI000E6D6C4B|nr:torso-like protein [Hyposmocoma kahamanoa]